MGQDDLRTMLARLPAGTPIDDLIVGHESADDAAVLRIDGSRVLVQTVDFFTPIVDDPELFGEIAAANAVSDIYAMGAEPILGLAIAAFPTDRLPLETLEAILRGGARKAAEAGFVVAGGHTIIDDVPKYGLVVTGIADAASIVRNSTARAGDLLYLTKPIGNGIIVSAARAVHAGFFGRLRRTTRPNLDEAIEWMTRLNRDAARVMVAAGVSAATDVTGYGLVGHLLEVCRGSGLGARLHTEAVPSLQGARDLLRRGHYPDGTRRNTDAFERHVQRQVDQTEYLLMCDAQTSGGLLIAVAPDRAADLERGLTEAGALVARVGEMTDQAGVVQIVP
ncbi:MAG TPA: selenide, water dikinase SelD [Thermoanaerobaculia bacterium]|nr:selenide, water dikinase SelD [Thermoanaerobaculia bacterium]